MSHTISGVAGSLLSQMLMGPRPNNTASRKPSQPFQTIDSDGEIAVHQQQVKQAVVLMSAAESLSSQDQGSTMERLDLQGSLSQDASARANSNPATGSSGVATPIGTLKSLAQLENQVSSAGNPGSVVNVLI